MDHTWGKFQTNSREVEAHEGETVGANLTEFQTNSREVEAARRSPLRMCRVSFRRTLVRLKHYPQL